MKTLLALCSLCFLLLNSAAHAQQYQSVSILAGGTANITAGSTSNYTATVNVRSANYVSIFSSFKLNGSGTDGIIFKFSKSSDGTTFETTPSILITNAANGTTLVSTVSPTDVSGVHSLKLATIINGVSGQAVTNLVVSVGVKNFLR